MRAHEARLGTRDRALLSTRVRAALASRRQLAGEEGGAASLAALPWLASVPVDILAREAARLERPGLNLALSALWQERLRVAAVQIERHGLGAEPGLAAATVLDLVRGDLEDVLPGDRSPGNVPARSLGAVAVCLRRLARRWRRHARTRAARSLAHA